MLNVFASALADIRAGLRLRRVWMALAHEDIGDQHRRTTLGPLWLLFNYLAFAGTFIFVFQRGDASTPHYSAYVATGLLVWFYMMETLTQSVTLFVREENFIKGTTLPLSTYVMRMATQSVMRAGYAMVGCLAILALSDVTFTAVWGWSVLAVILIILTAPAAITLFAFLGAYFPDSQFLVSNLMRIGMFLTPVFWTPGGHGIRNALYYYNPFTYFLEIVRIPILTGNVPVRSFMLCAAIACALWVVALVLLGRLRKQVVFVL